MNDLDRKKDFFDALGLTKVTAETKAMESSHSNSNNTNNNNNNEQFSYMNVRKRLPRRKRRGEGTKNHVFHLLTNDHIRKRKDTTGITLPKNKSTIVPNRNSAAVSAQAIVSSPNRLNLKPSPVSSMQKNLVFLPQTQNQQGIVLGQTIFQGPDGKKFVLVPSSSAKPKLNPSLLQSPVHASIRPIAGSNKPNNSAEVTTPSYIYVPVAQKGGPSNVGSFANLSTTLTNILPNNNLIISPPKNIVKPDGHHALQVNEQVQSSSPSNIIQLLNMTRSALSDTKMPINSMNLGVWSQATNQTLKLMKIQKQPLPLPTMMSTTLPLPTMMSTTLPLPTMMSTTLPLPTMMSTSLPLPTMMSTSLPLPTMMSTSLQQDSQLPSRLSVTSSGINSPVLSSTSINVPNNLMDGESGRQSTKVLNVVSDVSKIVTLNEAQGDAFALAGSSSRSPSHMPPPGIAEVPLHGNTITTRENADTLIVSSLSSAISTSNIFNDSSTKSEITNEEATYGGVSFANHANNIQQSPTKLSATQDASNVKNSGRYVGDPSKNLTNAETNCIVIQGKSKKKRGKGKNHENLQHRRYGGPPFTPCKAPPAPNTPSSSTCCLYEHTLLKMATRGFWGCEMGKLQDVFRSIRCESIDLDTVEDVTKRCYGFVRRKLLDAADEKEAMYSYMKNYIDEFDSFLDRVYPVAIIAILIYLPTATDYSQVTWHGIPPTGWSEYRRAVVMREVFEVLYRFGLELDMVPEYRSEFFDNPVKCPLLVPRVFELEKDFSDSNTCFVQKVTQPNHVKSEEASRYTPVEIRNKKHDSSTGHVSPRGVSAEKQEMVFDENEITSKNSTEEGFENQCHQTEELPIVSTLNKESLVSANHDRCDEEMDTSEASINGNIISVSDGRVTNSSSEAVGVRENGFINDCLVSELERGEQSNGVAACVSGSTSQIYDGETHVGSTAENSVLQNAAKLVNGNRGCRPVDENGDSRSGDENIDKCIDTDRTGKRIDTVASLNAGLITARLAERVVENRDNSIDTDGTGKSIDTVASTKTGLITARFAESIVAACGNMTDWKTAKPGSSVNETSLDSMNSSADRPGMIDSQRLVSVTATDVDGTTSSSDLISRRRSSKRIASVTHRLDHYLSASDELKLEKDFRKALKLSKLECVTGKFGESQLIQSPTDQKPGRIPLKIVSSEATTEPMDDELSNSPVSALPVLNRSVAFEALWTQQSVEEPTVLLHDNTSYNLGEYLEKYPIETHCPPASTVIIVCNEKYYARDIFGYLRRGTQLVEQQGDEIVIDTTRTVKKNSVILAVRKVPPGKISKLVHPELHLETYTGYLLPIGVTQPVKSKRNNARSMKIKRKSVCSRDDVLLKEEPRSPLTLSQSPLTLSPRQSEDSCSSPPPRKLVKVDSLAEGQRLRELSVSDAAVQASDKAVLVSTETQTEDKKDSNNLLDIKNHQCITSMESLEEVLNSALQSAMSHCLINGVNTTQASSSSFRALIDSYERAGKFLLNTAKTLETACVSQSGAKS